MSDKKQIGSLTALRFFAALAIVLHHSRGTILPEKAFFGVPLAAGVGFFFVLSGFILTYTYMGAMPTIREFFVSRVARIWPAHVFALVVLLALLPKGQWIWDGANEALVSLSNVSMLHSLIPIPAYYFSFNGPSWSISTEVCFYLAFPFLLYSIQETWHWKLLVVLGVGLAVTWGADAYRIQWYSTEQFTELSAHGLAYISPLARIQEFFIGMLAAVLFLRMKGSGFPTWLLSAAEALTIVAVATAVPHVTNEIHSGRFGDSVSMYLSDVATGLVFAGAILVFSFNGGIVSRILSLRPFVILGQISFSLYLLHQIFIRYYQTHMEAFDAALPEQARFWIFLGLSLAAAYATWRLVEIPAQRYLRMKFVRHPRSTQSVSLGSWKKLDRVI